MSSEPAMRADGNPITERVRKGRYLESGAQ